MDVVARIQIPPRIAWCVSLTARVLVALAAGIALGLLVGASTSPLARATISIVEPVGTLFINAIRMTVIPLVVSSLIVGIASASDGGAIARLSGRSILLFLGLLGASGLTGALVAPPVLRFVTANPAAVLALRGHSSDALSGSTGPHVQTLSEWISAIVPENPVRSAVDGAMLPLIVFSLAFGLALLTVEATRRNAVVTLLRGVVDAMLLLVRRVLVFTPVGVFALALPLVARLGSTAVRALATYVVLVSAASTVFVVLVVYPAAAIGGRMSIMRFARAILPAQTVAFSSRSSLAALPAMIETARSRLALSEEVSSFFLPLASATFRVGAALGLTVGALFIGRLYGIGLSATQIATIVVTAVLTSFSIPGVPGAGIIAMIPVLASVGLPIDGLGILLGVDTIPDTFRTTANVTGQLAAAVILGRRVAPEIGEAAGEDG